MFQAVRGAVSVENNRAEAIQSAVAALMQTLLAQNNQTPQNIQMLWFTVTPDLTALNPAQALRQTDDEAWRNVPMMCAQEPVVEGMLPRCIRVMLCFVPSAINQPPVPVYLGEAQTLRPDLAGNASSANPV